MAHLTLFNPSFRRLFSDPCFDLPVRFAGTADQRGNRASSWAPPPWAPPVDVRESDTEVTVEAELPGIPRQDISVRYHDGRLILEGRREETHEPAREDSRAPNGAPNGASEGWIRRERVLGRFQRSFELPDSVDASAIRAESRDGVLKVFLPKLEKAQPRRIDVSVH